MLILPEFYSIKVGLLPCDKLNNLENTLHIVGITPGIQTHSSPVWCKLKSHTTGSKNVLNTTFVINKSVVNSEGIY